MEVDVPSSPSLTVVNMVSVDVKQQVKKEDMPEWNPAQSKRGSAVTRHKPTLK